MDRDDEDDVNDYGSQGSSIMTSGGAIERPRKLSRKRGQSGTPTASASSSSLDDLLDQLSNMTTSDSRMELVTNFIAVFACTKVAHVARVFRRCCYLFRIIALTLTLTLTLILVFPTPSLPS